LIAYLTAANVSLQFCPEFPSCWLNSSYSSLRECNSASSCSNGQDITSTEWRVDNITAADTVDEFLPCCVAMYERESMSWCSNAAQCAQWPSCVWLWCKRDHAARRPTYTLLFDSFGISVIVKIYRCHTSAPAVG